MRSDLGWAPAGVIGNVGYKEQNNLIEPDPTLMSDDLQHFGGIYNIYMDYIFIRNNGYLNSTPADVVAKQRTRPTARGQGVSKLSRHDASGEARVAGLCDVVAVWCDVV